MRSADLNRYNRPLIYADTTLAIKTELIAFSTCFYFFIRKMLSGKARGRQLILILPAFMQTFAKYLKDFMLTSLNL